MYRIRRIACAVFLLTVAAQSPILVEGQTSGVVTINPAVTHQTMRGWEVVAQAEQFRSDFPAFQDAVLTNVVDAGIDRVRLEVRSGSEHVADAFAEWRAAGYPSSGAGYVPWRARRYETVNDNSDPNVIDPARFHWSEIDSTVDLIINPLRQKLAARGESLYVNLNYVAFYGQVTSGVPNLHQDPAEYAEFMLAAFTHLQSRHGWVPDAIEVVLEPDNTVNWSGALLGQVIAAAGARLAAAGFTPDFIAPGTTNMSTASLWIDQLWAVTAARPYLKELSYHRYSGVSTAALQAIASKAQAAGVSTSMLEWWDRGNTFHTLHQDLTVGRNSAWEQAAITEHSDPGALAISYVNPASPGVATLTSPTKFLRQYYQHVRRGAVRVGAATTSGALEPLAFRNPDGTFAVVVKAAAGGAVAVSGLPAGTYGLSYSASSAGSPTSPDLTGSHSDQTIAAGQLLTTSIPAYGVITVFGRTGSVPTPVPGSPSRLRVTSIVGNSVTLQWTPAAVGPATGFVLEGGVAPGQTAGALPLGLAPSVTVALPTGSYYLRVRTAAGAAVSGASNEVMAHVNVALPPSAPTDLRGLAVGDRLHLAWTNTLTGGGPATVQLDVAGALSGSLPLGLIDSFGFAGMPPGTYTFTVRAANAAGSSTTSNPVTLTFPSGCTGVPQPVANVAAFNLGSTLFLSWDLGAAGPAPTSYVLTIAGAYAGSLTTSLRALSGQVPPGTYRIDVTAANACGVSDRSAPHTVVVP
jgi:hypothetical protein